MKGEASSTWHTNLPVNIQTPSVQACDFDTVNVKCILKQVSKLKKGSRCNL